MKVALPSGAVAWTQELTFTPASYGLGDPYIYLRTSDYIASFNLSTGQFIAEVNLTTAKYPDSMNGWKFTRINHLWGFDTFASLGLLFTEATTGNVAMSIGGFDGSNMTSRYFITAPAAVSLNDYGNSVWAGLIAIPATNGLTLIGARGNTWQDTESYPLTVPASVRLNDEIVVFAYSAYVVGLNLSSPSL
jgi:hypothetical protein